MTPVRAAMFALAAASGLWIGWHPQVLDDLFPSSYADVVVEAPGAGVVPDRTDAR